MKKLRALVLVHETLVPPESTDGYSEQEIDEWRTEYDVSTCLRAMGHDVRVLGLGDNLADLRAAIVLHASSDQSDRRHRHRLMPKDLRR